VVPRSRSNRAIQRGSRKYLREGRKGEKGEEKKRTLPRAAITLFTEHELREDKIISLIATFLLGLIDMRDARGRNAILFRCPATSASRLIANEKGHVQKRCKNCNVT
jgi:hypothetical protein